MGESSVVVEQTENQWLLATRTIKQKRPSNKPRPRTPFDRETRYGRERFKVGIDAEVIPGTNNNQKILYITKALNSPQGLIAVRSEKNKEDVRITAIFGDQQAADYATRMSLPNLGDNKLSHMQIGKQTIEKDKSIVVWDIPLDTKMIEVRQTFSKYGDISGISMKTQNLWQCATITFEDSNIKDTLVKTRSILIKGDAVRINDAEWSLDQMKQRHNIAAKLINLPPGTRAWDLKHILEQIKACTCYIPRTSST